MLYSPRAAAGLAALVLAIAAAGPAHAQAQAVPGAAPAPAPAAAAAAAQAEAPARPPQAAPATLDVTRTKACAGRTDVLGVSRVVEIDTKGGQLFGQLQYKDNNFLEDGEVVLTFDDGPLRPYTIPVLKALDAHCTKATFFVVGRMAVADPDLVRETALRGHTIGTHTWSHRNMRTLGQPTAKGEIELAVSSIRKAAGQPTAPFFRFPFLADSRAMTEHLRSRDHGIFSIDVDSRDFRTRNPADVQRKILADLARQRKGILLFHDIQPSTAGALLALLGELKAKGFKVVHMIPKSPVATLAEFDAQADREFARKQIAGSRSPLANRAVVWPVSAGDDALPSSLPQKKPLAVGLPPAQRPAAALAPTAGAPQVAPQVLPQAAVAAPVAVDTPPPVVRPRWRTDEDKSWQERAFGD